MGRNDCFFPGELRGDCPRDTIAANCPGSNLFFYFQSANRGHQIGKAAKGRGYLLQRFCDQLQRVTNLAEHLHCLAMTFSFFGHGTVPFKKD